MEYSEKYYQEKKIIDKDAIDKTIELNKKYSEAYEKAVKSLPIIHTWALPRYEAVVLLDSEKLTIKIVGCQGSNTTDSVNVVSFIFKKHIEGYWTYNEQRVS